ncbi:hypothetical protein EVAR_27835_1 [Eumeta japonica]|uniref:Uncharacterized protein n=1 Tax=Eumeta variegata TaxID=151549 RepID=A0A4C1VHS3_EUMVA|nr:hypothetical protein EVAR_27835_1 [Eumeta japonica]
MRKGLQKEGVLVGGAGRGARGAGVARLTSREALVNTPGHYADGVVTAAHPGDGTFLTKRYYLVGREGAHRFHGPFSEASLENTGRGCSRHVGGGRAARESDNGAAAAPASSSFDFLLGRGREKRKAFTACLIRASGIKYGWGKFRVSEWFLRRRRERCERDGRARSDAPRIISGSRGLVFPLDGPAAAAAAAEGEFLYLSFKS